MFKMRRKVGKSFYFPWHLEPPTVNKDRQHLESCFWVPPFCGRLQAHACFAVMCVAHMHGLVYAGGGR